jgi:hypothetical protein
MEQGFRCGADFTEEVWIEKGVIFISCAFSAFLASGFSLSRPEFWYLIWSVPLTVVAGQVRSGPAPLLLLAIQFWMWACRLQQIPCCICTFLLNLIIMLMWIIVFLYRRNEENIVPASLWKSDQVPAFKNNTYMLGHGPRFNFKRLAGEGQSCC